MFDQKDVGTATGLTLYSLGLVLLFRDPAALRFGWVSLSTCLLFLGLVLAVGTRISMLLPAMLAAVVGLMAYLWLLMRTRPFAQCRNGAGKWLIALCSSGGLTYLALLVLYPLVFAHPTSALIASFRQSGDFQVFPIRPSRSYVVEWFAIQTPLLISLLFVVGTVTAVVLAGRSLLRPGTNEIFQTNAAYTIVLTQAFAVPVFAIAVQAILYHSLRHILFIYPAVSILAAGGVLALLRAATSRNSPRSRYLVAGVLLSSLTAMLVPSIDQTRLFPYGYAYFSPVGRVIGIDGRWATDYWRTSWRELYAQIPTNEFAVCPDSFPFPDDTMYDWPVDQSFSCAYETKISPFFTEAPNYDVSTGHFWFLREYAGGIYVPKNCRLHSRVTRPLGLGEITLSYLEYCQYVPSPSEVKG